MIICSVDSLLFPPFIFPTSKSTYEDLTHHSQKSPHKSCHIIHLQSHIFGYLGIYLGTFYGKLPSLRHLNQGIQFVGLCFAGRCPAPRLSNPPCRSLSCWSRGATIHPSTCIYTHLSHRREPNLIPRHQMSSLFVFGKSLHFSMLALIARGLSGTPHPANELRYQLHDADLLLYLVNQVKSEYPTIDAKSLGPTVTVRSRLYKKIFRPVVHESIS